MEITPLSKATKHRKVIFFGEPGSGKTSAAATMAHLGGKVLIVDLESNLVLETLENLGIPTDDILVARPKNPSKLYEELFVLANKLKAAFEKDPNYLTGFSLDSLSELQKKLTENLTEARVLKNKLAGKTGKAVDEFDIESVENMRASQQLRLLVRKFRDLPCHVAFTALQREDKEPDGTIYYRLGLGPKTSSDVMSFVNAVVHIAIEETPDGLVRIGRATPVGKWRGKDNIGRLPSRMIEPSFYRIAQLVSGDLDKDEADADYVAPEPVAEEDETAEG